MILSLFLYSCAFEETGELLNNPEEMDRIERRIKTKEDREYWEKVEDNYDDAIIILDFDMDKKHD